MKAIYNAELTSKVLEIIPHFQSQDCYLKLTPHLKRFLDILVHPSVDNQSHRYMLSAGWVRTVMHWRD